MKNYNSNNQIKNIYYFKNIFKKIKKINMINNKKSQLKILNPSRYQIFISTKKNILLTQYKTFKKKN